MSELVSLALVFMQLSLLAFGGTNSVIPEMQRQVVLLRDVERLSAGDVCNILALSETNVRVILHRGRAKPRQALDRYMRDGATSEGAAPSESVGRVAARGIR